MDDIEKNEMIDMERTVILLKPDSVKRALVGEIIGRFEKAGLKIVALKMVHVDVDVIAKHYSDDRDYLASIGEKTLQSYREYGK
ncbi:MAG: nucleoside-diphosphate kinase, partial [Parcubacteria group bacterium]